MVPPALPVGFRRFFRNRQLANYNSLGDHFLSIPLYPIFSHQVWVKIGYPNNWMVNTVNNTTNGYTDIPICGPIFNIHPHIPAIPSSGAATIPAAGRFFGVRSHAKAGTSCASWTTLNILGLPKTMVFPSFVRFQWTIPICSMVLEYLPSFALKITQFCR